MNYQPLKPNFDAIPKVLQLFPLWNTWAAEPRKNGKMGKPPIMSNGRYAQPNNPKTFGPYDTAKEFYTRNQGKILQGLKGPISGVGILIDSNAGFVGVDFDNVINETGEITEWALPFITLIKRYSYCEISPSGRGIRTFIYGKKPDGNCRRDDLEMYDHDRFLTITGHKLEGCPNDFANGQDAEIILMTLGAWLNNKGEWHKGTRPKNNPQGEKITPTRNNENMDDDAIIQKARTATNGNQFVALFDYGDTSEYKNDASAAELGLANKLAFWTRKDAAQMDRLMRQSALLQAPGRIEKWDKIHVRGMTYGDATISKAIQDTKTVYTPPAKTKKEKNISTREREIKALPQKPGKKTGKMAIEYAPGQMPRMRRELEAAMRNTTYQLGESLARVINVPKKEPRENEITYTTRIDPLSVDSALSEAEEVSSWYKIKADKKTGELVETPINAPLDVVKQLLSWKKWRLPLISGVVNCPVMRADGSIIDNPGYDSKTGLYAHFNPAEFPKVSSDPTNSEIQTAYSLIKSTISEFPFKVETQEEGHELPENNISRAVALSMLLTPLIQACLDNIPLFAITSPVPGTGKSYLADLVSIILCGARAEFMNFIPDEVEFEKAIFAKLLEGAQCCLIDNIDRPLNSAKLNSILTQERMGGRILGLSKNASVSTKCLFTATGNNLEIVGDLTRRTLLCTIDANTERPAERNFKNANLHEWALKHRGQLVHAGLTILRGHCVAGFAGTKDLKPFNSFNEWSKWIRGAVVWLGEADPVKSQDSIRESDSERQQFLDVVRAWHEAYGNKPQTAKDILDPPYNEKLHTALENAVPYKRELNTRALGKWLKTNKDRIIERKQIVGFMGSGEIMLWRVIEKL